MEQDFCRCFEVFGKCCASALEIRKPGIMGFVYYCATHSPSLPLMTGIIGPVDSDGKEKKRLSNVYLKDRTCQMEGCSNQMEGSSWFEVSRGCRFACVCSVKCCKAFSQMELNGCEDLIEFQ